MKAIRGRMRWFGLAFGALGGLADTWLMLHLGIDLTVAGRDLTLPVAAYLALTFAAFCFLIGHFADARGRERRDARIIREQLEALERSRRIAAQNEKLAAIGRLAAGVAHEVRNPLGVIRASASMVQESFDREDEAHRACEFICEEIDRLNGLITSLLTFARPSEPRFQNVSLEKVLDRALQLASGDLREREVEVVRESDGGPIELRADPDLLAQLVLGLVTNAAESLERGGRIALRADADPEALLLEIADSGPGIPVENAERVFEPFFTTKATGTGLGLAMTARIAEAHGGHVEVTQQRGAGPDGAGACFKLVLPLSGPDAPGAAGGATS